MLDDHRAQRINRSSERKDEVNKREGETSLGNRIEPEEEKHPPPLRFLRIDVNSFFAEEKLYVNRIYLHQPHDRLKRLMQFRYLPV